MFIFRKHSQGHFVLGLTTSFLFMVFPAAGSGVLTAQHPLHTPCCKDTAVRSQGMGDISFLALEGCSQRVFSVMKVLWAWLLILAASCHLHLGQVSLLFIFRSRNKVRDNRPFLGFCKSEAC